MSVIRLSNPVLFRNISFIASKCIANNSFSASLGKTFLNLQPKSSIFGIDPFRNCSRWARMNSAKYCSVFPRSKKENQTIVLRNNGEYNLRRTRQRISETKQKMKNKLQHVMKENIFTVPNGLCCIRIGLTPIIAYTVMTQNYEVSLALFTVAGVTDFLDGFIARTFPSQRSMIGSFLDPAADKLLVATLFLSLTYSGLIPVPLTCLVVSRDVVLMAAGLWIRYQSLPKPKTLSKYFNLTIATAQLSPTWISKVNTAVQLVMVAASLGAPYFGYVDHPCLQALWYLTGTTTVASIVSYLRAKNTYQFLSLRRRKV